MIGLRRPSTRRLFGLVALLSIVGAACASDAPQDTLQPAGPNARTIDNLFGPVFLAAVFVFFVVEGVIVYAVFRYRRREGDDEDVLPAQVHGNTRLEVGWTILPALILAVVAVFTVPVIFELNERPDDALEVNVYGQKYWWSYEYAGQQVGGGRDFQTANELHIPAGRPVFLRLTSRDVIHSFWAPRLNGKRDVMPNREHTWRLEADEPGAYSGQCAEFCGDSHTNMRLKVVAHDQAGFEDWVASQQEEPDVPTSGAAQEGYDLFEARCATCHQVDGSFEEVAADSPPAPNLSHLFARNCFAGCMFERNRNELEEWLRNPQRKAGSLMVIAQLTEPEIDQLYAYLETLE